MDGREELKAEQAAALGVSMNVQLDANRQLAMQTYLPRDASVKEMHELVDKLAKVANRQVAKSILISHRKELKRAEKALADQIADTKRVTEQKQDDWVKRGRKGPFKLDQKDETALQNLEVNKEKFAAEIADLKEQIKAREAEIENME